MLEMSKVYKLSEKMPGYLGNALIPVYGMSRNNIAVPIDTILYSARLIRIIPRFEAKFLIEGKPYRTESGHVCDIHDVSTLKLICISGVTIRDLKIGYIVEEEHVRQNKKQEVSSKKECQGSNRVDILNEGSP